MTLSPWMIYLWGISDRISGASILLAITLAIFALFVWMSILDATKNQLLYPSLYGKLDIAEIRKTRGRIVKWCMAVSSLSFLIFLCTPSSKTIAVMIIAPAIVNSEPIQKDLPEMYQMAKEALKQTLSP